MQVEAWPTSIMPLRRAMQCNKDSMNAVEYIGLPLFHHSSTISFSQLLMPWGFLARIKKKQEIRKPPPWLAVTFRNLEANTWSQMFTLNPLNSISDIQLWKTVWNSKLSSHSFFLYGFVLLDCPTLSRNTLENCHPTFYKVENCYPIARTWLSKIDLEQKRSNFTGQSNFLFLPCLTLTSRVPNSLRYCIVFLKTFAFPPPRL